MTRKRNPEETMKMILETTLKLFKEKGYEDTNVLDIVNAMGVSRGAFYHYFKSKEEVLYALIEGKDFKEYETSIYENPQLTGLEKIRKLMFYVGYEQSKLEVEEEDFLFNIWLDLLISPRILMEHLKESQSVDVDYLIPLLKLGMKDGSIRSQNPRLLAELILLFLNFWTLPTIYPVNCLKTFEEKLEIAKAILERMGCPLINQEVSTSFIHLAKSYYQTHEFLDQS